MYVLNEATRKFESNPKNLVKCAVAYEHDIIEFGYVNPDKHLCVFCYSSNYPGGKFLACYNLVKDKLNFERRTGLYTFNPVSKQEVYAAGGFPYTFTRYYNTRFLNDMFEKWREDYNNIQFRYADEMPYTFGLEFETSGGYIPEHELLHLGLIPLRDGSINGLEYSTIVLKGQKGLNTLYEMIKCLRKYTIFDKECSLHVHLGNWRLSEDTILRLNNLFSSTSLGCYLPRDTYNTERYKATGKSYCKRNASYSDFNTLYETLVGRSYYGDLRQPHPKDISGTRKWNICTRYKALNLINALCYNFGKTAEFRILRPTYNFDKIICWLYIFAAFIKYAEKGYRVTTSIDTILNKVYSPELVSILKKFLQLEREVVEKQTRNGDYIGADVSLEDSIITKQNLSSGENFFY